MNESMRGPLKGLAHGLEPRQAHGKSGLACSCSHVSQYEGTSLTHNYPENTSGQAQNKNYFKMPTKHTNLVCKRMLVCRLYNPFTVYMFAKFI